MTIAEVKKSGSMDKVSLKMQLISFQQLRELRIFIGRTVLLKLVDSRF